MGEVVVGTLVKQRRSALGLTQVELGRRTGLSQNYISKLENGDVDLPQRGTLDALGGALQTPVEDFYRAAGVLDNLEEMPSNDIERDQVFALMMAHKQAGPMLIRLKAEAPVDEYDDLLDEALEHFAISLGRRLRRRREEMGDG